MNAALQAGVVFAIVAVATSYAVFKFMPKAGRHALAAWAAGAAVRFGFSDHAARRVEAKLASGGACGSCDDCGACAKLATDVAETTASRYPQIPIRRA